MVIVKVIAGKRPSPQFITPIQNKKQLTITTIVKKTNTGLQLRDYQKDAVDSFYTQVNQGFKSGIISAPTGSGKSIIISDICKTFAEKGKKVIVCTHRKELILQNENTLNRYCNDIDTGVFSAGCKRKELNAPVIFAGIMSIYNSIEELEKVDLLIIDEAHRVNFEENTTYAKLIDILRKVNPDLIVLGLSATPYRLKQGLLYEGKDRIFETLYYEISVDRLLIDGWLAPVISKGGVKKIDLTNVHTKMGEYDARELSIAADKNELTQHAVNEICELGKDRKAWIIFTTGIEHALHVCDTLKSKNITCEMIDSTTNIDARNKILSDYKNGLLRCIVNVNILTEGFDFPKIDLIALLMSTKSPSKFVQAVGRGMRLAEDKKNCLVLDYGSNTLRLGTINSIIPPTKDETPTPTVKECFHCNMIIPITAKVCPFCNKSIITFKTERVVKHNWTAYDGDLLSVSKWVIVDFAQYSCHESNNGKENTLRCDYIGKDRKTYSEFLSLSQNAHKYAYSKSLDKIRERFNSNARSIEDALKESKKWKTPTEIFVVMKNGYPSIEKMIFK